MEASSLVDALYSRVAIIPGGQDWKERPIIVVDAELSTRAAKDYLDKALKYYSSIFSAETRKSGLCIVINAQKSTWRTSRLILNQIYEIFRDESACVIVLRPEAFWDKRRVENCAARLVQSSRNEATFIPISRLSKYISLSHLPEELGGGRIYNHSQWIENRMKVEAFTKLTENAIINLESVRRRLNAAKDENSSSSYVSPQTYQTTKEETLKTISTGHALIEQLEKYEERLNSFYSLPKDILDTKERISSLLKIIHDKMTLVDESWVDVRVKNELMKEVMKIEDGVSEVTNWILERGEMLLNSQQNVGYDVVSAEDLRRNHESLELQCTKPYGHYAEILRKLNTLARNGTRFPRDLKSQKDFMDFVCRSFATRVERRRNVLITSARFFRLVSEYFQITSDVYENLIMRVDVETLESADETLEELQKSLNNIDALEKELMKEGEKLSDLLSIPVKDALGRELAINYQEDIVNVREILEMTIARRQLFKDSVELRILTLRQIIHIHNYENNASQAVEWLNELYEVMLKSHSHIGCSVHEIQIQKERHQSFQETAKETFEFGCQLLEAALVLRHSCKLSEHKNSELSNQMWKSWKKIYEFSQEQLTRLRVSAVFHRNVDQHCQQLTELIESFVTFVVEENTPKKRTQLKNTLSARENILTEVGRMMRLGRMLKSRLKQPLKMGNEDEGVMCNNEVATTAISEKLSEVTILAEQLDRTLCGYKCAMESDSIKKLLEMTETSAEVTCEISSCEISKCSNKNLPESSGKSDSNKSDEDYVTASSESTATPPSRSSSYHTASEGESNYFWWDQDRTFSSENEHESSDIKSFPRQQTEVISALTHRGKQLKKNETYTSNGLADLKQICNNQNDPIQLGKSSQQLGVPIPPLTNDISLKSHKEVKHDYNGNIITSSNANIRTKMSPQSYESLINQLQNENSHSFSDRFSYQERFMKRAITGIF